MRIKFDMDRKPRPTQYQNLRAGDPFLVLEKEAPPTPWVSGLALYIKMDHAGTTKYAVQATSGKVMEFSAETLVFYTDTDLTVRRIIDG